MWIAIGFGAMGLLLGNLLGMTSEPVVKYVIGILFTFVGGTVFAFLQRLTEKDRAVAGQAVFALSLGCLIGVYSGVWVNQHRSLSPTTAAGAQPVATPEFYLRNANLDQANEIDREKQAGVLNSEQAYEKMYRLMQNSQEQRK